MRYSLGGVRCSSLTGILASFLVVAGCGTEDHDKTDACELSGASFNPPASGGGSGESQLTQLSQVQDRKVIGEAAAYVPDLGLAVREQELRTSMAARRAAAWQIVQRVLTPVPLGEPRLAEQFGGTQPLIPTWHTWYAKDDLERMFKKLYADLGAAGRRVREPFTTGALGDIFAWNAQALDELDSWPEQRYLDYLAAVQKPEAAAGIGDINRVSYSPGASQHLLASYPQMLACKGASPPAAFAAEGTRPGRDIEAHEAVGLESCEWRALGPYVAASTSTFTVTLAGTGDADLYVRRGSPPTPDAYDCRSDGDGADETCTVDGGGTIYVAVFGPQAATVTARVAYREDDVAAPTCLDGEMTADAVLIKANWKRAQFGEQVAIYDTSAARMAGRLVGKTPEWGPGDGTRDPGAADIYTVTTPVGSTFRLTGMHISSKELPHWMWISLWWSPDPDTDFGADRPASVAALPGPWKNYKMCVSMDYLEGDAGPGTGLPAGLAEALAATSGGAGTPTWCSNPYIEEGAGNLATNCIGCHQHGGTEFTAEQIISGDPQFPHNGRDRVRNNFFTDYTWTIQGGRGEDLGSMIKAEADFWDAGDP